VPRVTSRRHASDGSCDALRTVGSILPRSGCFIRLLYILPFRRAPQPPDVPHHGQPSFLFHQWFDSPRSARLGGTTTLVTGSSVGLGRQVTRELAQNHVSRVILTVRGRESG
jgi:hypothetical protein